MAHDPKQKDIRAFFGGGKASESSSLPEGRSASNAEDEADIEIR